MLSDVFLSISLLVGLYLGGIDNFFIIGASVILVSFARSKRILFLAGINIIFIVAFDFPFRNPVDDQNMLSQLSTEGGTSLGISSYIFSKVGGLLFLLVFLIGISALLKKVNYRHIILVNLLAVFSLMGCFSLAQNLWIRVMLLVTIVIYTKFFWAIAYTQIANKKADGSQVQSLLSVFSFWSYFNSWHINSIPRGWRELESTQRTDRLHETQSRWSGVRLIFIGLMGRFGSEAIRVLFFSNGYVFPSFLGFTSFFEVGLNGFNELDLPVYKIWLTDLAEASIFILSNFWFACLVVGVIRFAGFQIPRAMYRLGRAKNYMDFLRHIYFYYVETIAYFFYYPTWELFKKLPISLRYRMSLSVFVSLVWGGYLTHLMMNVPKDIQNGFFVCMLSSLYLLPYIVILGFSAGISSLWQSPQSGETHTAKFFILYFVALIFRALYMNRYAVGAPSADWSDFVRYLLSHLGL